jgi:cytoskeletal protein RodZ
VAAREPSRPERPSRVLYTTIAILVVAVLILGFALLTLLGQAPQTVADATDDPGSSMPASAEPASAEPPQMSSVVPSASPTTPPTLAPTTPPSAPPTATTAPAKTPATAPAIAAFVAPATVDCTNESVVIVRLSWHVERATGVTISIDGPGIYDSYGPTDAADLPFSCGEPQHTYLLTTTGGTGSPATQQKVITRAP